MPRKIKPEPATAALLSSLALFACACAPEMPQLVKRPAQSPARTLISNTAVLDVRNGELHRGRDVLIEDGKIGAIGDHQSLKNTAGARVIDASGTTLLPGLIDSHGHITLDSSPAWNFPRPNPEANLRAYLYAGVTTVFDPSDPTSEAYQRREQVERAVLPGPHIYTAGKLMTASGGHPVALIKTVAPWWIGWYLGPQAAVEIDSEQYMRTMVAQRVSEGADFIKVVVDAIPLDAPLLDGSLVHAAVDEARARGLRTVAHIGTYADAITAADAGVDAWIHLVYKQALSDEQAAKLAAYGIPMIPTLTVWNSYAEMLATPRNPSRLERESVYPEVLESFNHPPESSPLLDVFGPYLELLRQQQDNWATNVRRLRAAGVTMLAGSDTQSGVFPGAGLHKELGYLHEAGMSPAEAIRAATYDAARFLSGEQDPDFGLVETGKRADLLLVGGDPTQSLEALADIREIFHAGIRIERIALDWRG